MQALKFKASVKDGMIRIPTRYRAQVPAKVKIILFPLIDQEKEQKKDDFIGYLLANPLIKPGFRPFSREELHGRSL